MKLLLASAALAVSIALSSCSEPPSKQEIGLVTGGAVGALVGSQFGGGTGALVATGVGAVGGALIGSEIGKSMDKTDSNSSSS